MNKFFKVIWSKSLGQKVIVAENAKCVGKSTSTTGNGVKTLVLGVAMVFGGQVWAGNVCDGIAASNANSGQNLSSTSNGWNSFVCGEGNSADGDNSAVFGISNSAAATHSVVLGNSSQVTAQAASGLAVGHQAVTSGVNGISLGYQVQAQASNAIAIGYKATASQSDSVALGANTTASASNAVALGANSVANVANTVSVGSTSLKRKIINVAAGDTSSTTSTDAVNGGQLFATNQNVSNLTNLFNTSANQFVSVLGGGASFTNGVFTAPRYSIQTQSYSNIGSTFAAVDSALNTIKSSVTDLKTYVDVQDSNTTSNGTNLASAQAYTDTKTAAALQDAMNYINELKITILNNANTYTDQVVSGAQSDIGQYVNVNKAPATSGASATGTNSVAIGTNTTVTGNNSTAVGIGNTVSGNKSGAFGDPNIVTGNGSYVVGNDNTVSGDNTFVLGNNVNTTSANSVVLGNNSTSDRDNTVSVGSSSSLRQITYVAAGTEDTDAVNVAQLNQSSADTLSSANSYTDTKFADIESVFKDYSLQNERRFQEVNKRFDRQGAMSAAMMNMATSTSGLQGRNRIGVGAGLQGQEQAVAVGYQRVVNSNTTLTISGALSREESSGGVGVGFGW